MKGIILAGGSRTSLHLLTLAVSRQLMQAYDKPMIYYPLSKLMLAGINKILIKTTPHDLPNIEKSLGDGYSIGCKFSYKEQPSPDGLAHAVILGAEFMGGDKVTLIFGDNIFHPFAMCQLLQNPSNSDVVVVFAYQVNDPERNGFVEFNENNEVISIDENPMKLKSHFAVSGIYFYDNNVVEIEKNIKPLIRGKLEIMDINAEYLKSRTLILGVFNRGTNWFDLSTIISFMQAGQVLQLIEECQGMKIGAIEEVYYRMGYINKEQLLKVADPFRKIGYGEYLIKVRK